MVMDICVGQVSKGLESAQIDSFIFTMKSAKIFGETVSVANALESISEDSYVNQLQLEQLNCLAAAVRNNAL